MALKAHAATKPVGGMTFLYISITHQDPFLRKTLNTRQEVLLRKTFLACQLQILQLLGKFRLAQIRQFFEGGPVPANWVAPGRSQYLPWQNA